MKMNLITIEKEKILKEEERREAKKETSQYSGGKQTMILSK